MEFLEIPDSHRAEGVAMICFFERREFRAVGYPEIVMVLERNLQCGFDRAGAVASEQDMAIRIRHQGGQFRRQFDGARMGQVAEDAVLKFRRLLPDRLHDARMIMSQAARPPRRYGIHIATTVSIEQVKAFAPDDHGKIALFDRRMPGVRVPEVIPIRLPVFLLFHGKTAL